MPIEEELSIAKKRYLTAPDLPRHAPGRVIGIGIGQIKADEPDKKSLHFFVERKMHKDYVHERFRIEKEYQGVPTKVIETGRIVSFQGGPGSSIGFDERDLDKRPNVDPAISGTLGAVVALGDSHYILGSNHAMAVNGRATGAQIVIRPPDRLINDPEAYIVARITDHVHLTQERPNTLDCALAKIIDKSPALISAEFPRLYHVPGLKDGDRIVTSPDGIDPHDEERVVRVDQIDAPMGTIVSVGTRPRFDFSFGSFDFEDLVLIEGDDNKWNLPFAKPGDSGGLVAGFDKKSKEYRATAIVMGGSRRKVLENGQWKGQWKSYTFACSYNTAVAALQKKVLERLGIGLENLGPEKSDDPHKWELRLVFSLPPAKPAKRKTSSLTPAYSARKAEVRGVAAPAKE
jgi:hypothetical protein